MGGMGQPPGLGPTPTEDPDMSGPIFGGGGMRADDGAPGPLDGSAGNTDGGGSYRDGGADDGGSDAALDDGAATIDAHGEGLADGSGEVVE